MAKGDIALKLPERFDFNHYQTFTDDYQKALGNGSVTRLVLDFSTVVYLDSSAIGMINMMYKKAKDANKTVCIRGAKGVAYDLLKLANIQKLIPME
ncbi:STAS domain-containing protein [Reinekea blandensis]|uniref:SpoIIAA family protein n=1 Tax=Reinekea blandensis MED297 TaxID=314283 RepID=A4BJG0_9GAMM|nr:STAS domain-containing protein [Reinekea blandensis]EAR07732.1 SpoIIAA family protein [Reinekea sp. MED297] [Reinekea blandensis MED297]